MNACESCAFEKSRMDAAQKFDDGKLRYDLVSAIGLEEIVKVYTYGAHKYADNNWRKGLKWSRIFAAIMRHLWAFWRGENVDKESGLPHLAHAGWGILSLLEFQTTHSDLDDRRYNASHR